MEYEVKSWSPFLAPNEGRSGRNPISLSALLCSALTEPSPSLSIVCLFALDTRICQRRTHSLIVLRKANPLSGRGRPNEWATTYLLYLVYPGLSISLLAGNFIFGKRAVPKTVGVANSLYMYSTTYKRARTLHRRDLYSS